LAPPNFPRFLLLAPVLFLCLFSLPSAAHPQRGQSSRRADDSPAEIELQKAIALTQAAKFQEAIPHFLAARGQVSNDYALNFNLALCYVATGQFPSAIEVLNRLRSTERPNANVENLLAQALLGNRHPDEALAAVQRAARLAPKDEKLYLYVAEACMDGGYAEVGMKVVDLGLKNLPRSPRLLFEHAMLLAQLDLLDEAKQELQKVAQIAPSSDVGYIAAVQRSFFDGNIAEALRVARQGVRKGIQHSMFLALYGEAVMQSGIEPADPEFARAREALERAVADRPAYSSAQISLGKLYLMEGRLDDAIAHLNIGRQLDPRNPPVYSNLAAAYRRKGDAQQAEAMLAILAKLNQEQAERIRNAPGDRKPGYASKPGKSPRIPPEREP
jgi:tetratricopeptide (TPR) repeat protein